MIFCALRTLEKRISQHAPSKHYPIMSQTRVCMCVNLCVRVMQAWWTAALRPMALDTQHFVLSCVAFKKDHNRRAAFSFCLTLLIGYLTKKSKCVTPSQSVRLEFQTTVKTMRQDNLFFFFFYLFKCAKLIIWAVHLKENLSKVFHIMHIFV